MQHCARIKKSVCHGCKHTRRYLLLDEDEQKSAPKRQCWIQSRLEKRENHGAFHTIFQDVRMDPQKVFFSSVILLLILSFIYMHILYYNFSLYQVCFQNYMKNSSNYEEKKMILGGDIIKNFIKNRGPNIEYGTREQKKQIFAPCTKFVPGALAQNLKVFPVFLVVKKEKKQPWDRDLPNLFSLAFALEHSRKKL